MAACEKCGAASPARGFRLCLGCLALGLADDLVDHVVSGPANRLARAAVSEMGPVVVEAARRRLQRKERPPEVSGLQLLQQLGFSPEGARPTRREVEEFRRRMARAYHQDLGKAPVSGNMMTRINGACDEVMQACE